MATIARITMSEDLYDIVILGAAGGVTPAPCGQLGKKVCPHRGGQTRRHVSAPRLHPDQGVAAEVVTDSTRERGELFRSAGDPQGIDMPGSITSTRTASSTRLYKGCRAWSSRDITYVTAPAGSSWHRRRRGRRAGYRGRARCPWPPVVARSLPGLDIGGRIITSDQALQMDFVPKTAIVLGGGVIGVEFAERLTSFGAEVTIVEALPPWCLPRTSPCSKALERAFRKRKIAFHTGVGSPAPRRTTPRHRDP